MSIIIEELRDKIASLDRDRALVFMLHITKRLYPNYQYFLAKEKFEDDVIVDKIIAYIEFFLTTNQYDNETAILLREKLMVDSPNADEHSSLYTTFALDVYASVYDLLTFLIESDSEAVIRVFDLALNTVYIYKLEEFDIHPLDDYPDDEIFASDEMVDELNFQNLLVDKLFLEKDYNLLVNEVINISYEPSLNLDIIK